MKYIEKTNEIIEDKYTDYVFEAFDIQDKKKTVVQIPINFGLCKTFDWNIGVIYGGSGTGKTTLLKEFGKIETIIFDNKKPLISNFDWLTPKDATILLSSIGLSSVPTWLRPFHTLSNGEQYRAELAYKIAKAKEGEVILIDEFTSVVDRDVAKAMSNALQKFIRRSNKRIILSSCHFDIMEWLLPDWTYSPIKGRVERHDCRRQSRPKIKLSIFRCRYETWNVFKRHHYLSQDLNKASKCFVAIMNSKFVGFIAILPLPHGSLKDAYRVTRVVILPDYQGLGIGFKLVDYFGELYASDNKTMYIKTSNPALFGAMKKNQNRWECVVEMNNKEKTQGIIQRMKDSYGKVQSGLSTYRDAITKSYKYIGPKSNDSNDIITFNKDAYEDVAQNQISLF